MKDLQYPNVHILNFWFYDFIEDFHIILTQSGATESSNKEINVVVC